MNKLFLAAFLALGLPLALQSCTTDSNQEMAPAATNAPKALQTAKFILDENP